MIVPYLGEAEDVAKRLPRAQTLEPLIAPYAAGPLTFERLSFNHPVYIMFSSGTTGVPKCIVHGAGGTLLQHLKEHQLQCDLRDGDRLFYFTTYGWMMWNWLASGIASGATLILYDGSPFAPSPNVLWEYARAERINIFGTSAKYIDSCNKEGLEPAKTHDLSSIKLIVDGLTARARQLRLCLSLHQIRHAVGLDRGRHRHHGLLRAAIHHRRSSAARYKPRAGHGSRRLIGARQAGKRSRRANLSAPGRSSSMPVVSGTTPTEEIPRCVFCPLSQRVVPRRFRRMTAHGGMIIHGRSDATLNPGGVRIGTAEIYAQVEQIPEVTEALAIGQDWDSDVRVVLFVRLHEGAAHDAM